jgi:hypothetical protein
MNEVGLDAKKLYKGLQVDKNIFPLYREGVTKYTVNQDIEVAFSIALENPDYGVGGFPQYFIEDFDKVLDLVFTRLMINR